MHLNPCPLAARIQLQEHIVTLRRDYHVNRSKVQPQASREQQAFLPNFGRKRVYAIGQTLISAAPIQSSAFILLRMYFCGKYRSTDYGNPKLELLGNAFLK